MKWRTGDTLRVEGKDLHSTLSSTHTYKHPERLKHLYCNLLANRFDILYKSSHHCRHYGQIHNLDKITKRAVTGTSSLDS